MSYKICMVTGSRAEYGLFHRLMREVDSDGDLCLQVVVTGMHLSPEFGLTYRQIEEDGFRIDKSIEILLSSDTAVGISKSMGLALIGFSEAFSEFRPDIIVVLGDRFETFCAATAGHVARIPIAHIHGGEVTEGAIDEAFRHSITKMSHLHFTSTEAYRRRVIQLGENPDCVFNVGALGVENMLHLDLLDREALEKAIGFRLGERCVLVTFHPPTIEPRASEDQFRGVLRALDAMPGLRAVFTGTNSDPGGRAINRMIEDYVDRNRERTVAFASMGQLRYLSALKHVHAVVGNSSSGIIEAPSLKTPSVNVGDRQSGRIKAESTIDCQPTEQDILGALNRVFSPEFRAGLKHLESPYEGKETALLIKETIKGRRPHGVMRKKFHDIVA